MSSINCEQLVYIVGHSRGGTTWLGSLIGLHPKARYIFEPFASQAHPYTGIDTQTLFNNNRRYKREKVAPVAEYPSPHFFNMDADIPELEPYKSLVQIHQTRLVERLFGDVSHNLVALKQPRMENFGWALSAVQPDKTLVIDRNPFGIINSYYQGDFWNWMRHEYPHAQRNVPLEYPQFAPLFEGERDQYERLLILSYVRSQVVADYCRQHGILVVDYKTLCLNTVEVMRQVADAIDLSFDDDYRAKIEASIHPEKTSEGWLDVNKDPVARMNAWRRELPVPVIERLSQFIQRYKMAVDYPGSGLPPLSTEEIAANRTNMRNRSIKHLLEITGRLRRRLLP